MSLNNESNHVAMKNVLLQLVALLLQLRLSHVSGHAQLAHLLAGWGLSACYLQVLQVESVFTSAAINKPSFFKGFKATGPPAQIKIHE